MRTFTLEALQDKHLGQLGTEKRDLFEYELQMDLIGSAVKPEDKIAIENYESF